MSGFDLLPEYIVAYQQTARRDRADAGAQTYRDKKISHWAAKSRLKNTLTKIKPDKDKHKTNAVS